MGLRKLLGLPPKKSKITTPPPQPSQGDPATYDAAKQKYDQVAAHVGLALLTDAQRSALTAARQEASGLQAHNLYDDAAKRLKDATGVAAGQIVKAQTAKRDFDATKPKISGVMDGARLLGVPADHMKALQDRYNAITAGADTDIVATAKALAELGRDIANDATIKDAKRARDKVLTDKSRVETEAAEALKIPQKTPTVLKQHGILADAVPNIGANSGKLNFMEAARYIEVCEACIAIINAEAPDIAAAIRDFDAAKPKISGVMDGAHLLGVPADHMKALQDRYNAITADADTDIVATAKALAELGRDIANDATIKDAKRARDKVLTDKSRVEAEAAEALKIPQKTPTVLKQHGILADAVPNIGANSGKLNFMEAARYIEVCEACIAIINAEAPGIAAAIALRDDVTANRKLLDGDINAARLIYGTSKEAKGLIEQFQNLDQAFEGAMYAKDYKVAQTYLKRLTAAAKRVLELKPAMDADEQARADHKAELKVVRKEVTDVRKIPAATSELGRILVLFEAKISAYSAAYNAKEWEQATALVLEIKTLRVEFMAAAADAAGELNKDFEKVVLWESDCKARYAKLDKIKGTTPEMTAAIANAKAAFDASNAQSTAKDFTAALASTQKLKGLLDTIDGLKAANDEASKKRNKAWTEYKKNKALCNEALAIKPNTPEMAALFKTFVDAHSDFHNARKRGEDGLLEQLPGIITAAQAVVDGKDENAAGRDEGRKAANDAKDAGAADFWKAKGMAEKYLPSSQAELDAHQAANVEYGKLLGAGRYMESIEHTNLLMAANKAIFDGEAQWIADAGQVKADYDLRYAPVKADYDKVVAYQHVLPGLDGEITAVQAQKQAADTEYTGGNMGKASGLLDKLEASVALLVAKKAAHDTGVTDKAWIAAKKTSIGSDVDAACDDFALMPETQDIQSRLNYAKKVATIAETGHNFAGVRAQWVELERLLVLWQAKETENDDAWDGDVKEVSRRLKAVKTERDTASEISPITPDLKKLKTAYGDVTKRFWRAYESLDWVLALSLMDDFERTVKALAAAKGDYDAALLLAQPIAAAATQALTDISESDLKAKPTEEKLKLLDEMRATGEDLTTAQRKLQRKLYSSLDYDADFKEADEKRRDELVKVLKADEDVKEARGKWGEMDDDARLAVLIKVMNAECKVFNIPPPAVRLFYEPPGDEGFFSGDSMTLNLNTHPDSGWTDFKEAVNTVVHENMHNYQEVLVRRLNEGIITKEDPEYVQALIFASNDAPGGYVDTNEKPDANETNQKPYKTQPVEAHAWDSGDGVAGDLMAEDPPDENEVY